MLKSKINVLDLPKHDLEIRQTLLKTNLGGTSIVHPSTGSAPRISNSSFQLVSIYLYRFFHSTFVYPEREGGLREDTSVRDGKYEEFAKLDSNIVDEIKQIYLNATDGKLFMFLPRIVHHSLS